MRETLRLIRSPEIVAATIRAVRTDMPETAEGDIVVALDRFWELWAALIPAEQARIVRLLVERVVVRGDSLAVTLRTGGLGQIAREMLGETTSTDVPAAPTTRFALQKRQAA